MSGEVRVLPDPDGVLGPTLRSVVERLGDVPYALVGGLAVLLHVPGHRVTEDLDSAVRSTRRAVASRLGVVATSGAGADVRFQMPEGAPVDVLLVSDRPPRPGMAPRRVARREALTWALESASSMTLATTSEAQSDLLEVQVASPAALVAMKATSVNDRQRGAKRATDLLDVWRLLSADIVATAGLVDDLVEAPGSLPGYVGRTLTALMRDEPARFIDDMASVRGAKPTIADVRDLWGSLLEPRLS